MNMFNEIPVSFWPYLVLISASLFALFWAFDAATHKRIAHTDITDQELNQHRIILIASFVLELSLVLSYWFGWMMLPLFIAAFLTRTIHEFIDELNFHVNRCTQNESFLHLGMWISVLTKTVALFIWGFILNYQGFDDLNTLEIIWGILLLLILGYTSLVEWRR